MADERRPRLARGSSYFYFIVWFISLLQVQCFVTNESVENEERWTIGFSRKSEKSVERFEHTLPARIFERSIPVDSQ